MHVLKFIVANNILRLRTDAGMSRAELGEKIRYSEDYILRWERAEEMPDDEELAALAGAFGVTTDYLLNPHDEWVSKEEREYLANASVSAPNIETKNLRAKPEEKSEPAPAPEKKKSKKPFAIAASLVAVFAVFWFALGGELPSAPSDMESTTEDWYDSGMEDNPSIPGGGFAGGENHKHEYRDYWEIAFLQTPYENGEERKYCYNCEAYLYRPIYASTVGLFYENHGDGTCTVTDVASGPEFNLGLDIIVVPPYINEGEEILKVVAVGESFLSALGASHDTIKEVRLPDTVERIGSYAFGPCTAIEQINIPRGVTHIGDYAFAGLKSLKSIDLPEDLEYIGEGAFSGCESLEEIRIPGSIDEILPRTFENCINLQHVSMDYVRSIGAGAFNTCISLKGGFSFDQLHTIEAEAFYGCQTLCDIQLGSSLTYIGERAFSDCKNLNSVKFAQGGETLEIGDEAFKGSKIYGLEIFDNVSRIGSSAFEGCIDLENVTVYAEEIGYGAFFYCESLEYLHLGDGVKYIGSSAFEGCSALKEIKIPESVRKIEAKAFHHCTSATHLEINASLESIDSYVFAECENLESVDLCDMYAWGYAELFCGNESIKYLSVRGGYIPEGAFEGCINLELVELSGVDKVENNAFKGCTALEKVNSTYEIESIGSYAFSQTAIEVFEVCESIMYIGEGVFSNCPNMNTINFRGTMDEWESFSKTPGWDAEMPYDYIVSCLDGVIAKK